MPVFYHNIAQTVLSGRSNLKCKFGPANDDVFGFQIPMLHRFNRIEKLKNHNLQPALSALMEFS